MELIVTLPLLAQTAPPPDSPPASGHRMIGAVQWLDDARTDSERSQASQRDAFARPERLTLRNSGRGRFFQRQPGQFLG
ncbi:hypothetical protein Pla8534_46980 [Lignipirellula cremea]|uniref:Uncharacterized protein n=1 Tax=Lignipirellula cremea TaxID=2528010 RepID=A0A518DYF7_9BACT|nr:hypothetical protein Pla8534_46980 [Lignipirellula cremea]